MTIVDRPKDDEAPDALDVALAEVADPDLAATELAAHMIEAQAAGSAPSVTQTASASFRSMLREASDWGSIRRSPYGFTPVLALSMTGFFLSLSAGTFSLAAPDILHDLHIKVASIINVSAFVGGVTTVLAIGVAYLADRRRRVPMFGAGLIGAGIFSALIGRSQTVLSMAVPMVASDTALTISGAPRGSLMADYYPPAIRGKVFALLGLLGIIGGTAAPLIVGQLISRLGWRAAYAITAVPVVLVGVFVIARLREPVRGFFERQALGADDDVASIEDEAPSFGEAWRTVWGIRTLRRLFIAGIWSSAGSLVFALFSVLLFFEHYGLTVTQRSVLATSFALFVLPGTFLGGGLVDVLMRRRPSQVLNLVGAFGVFNSLSILLFALAPPIWLIVVVGGVQAFFGSLLGPTLGVLYVQILPSNVRSLGGAMDGLSTLPGTLIILPMAAVIEAKFGLQAGIVFAFVLIFIGACINWSAAPFFEFDMRSAFASNLAGEEWRRAKTTGRGKLLVCRSVDVEYDGVQVLFGVDFDVDEGQIIALLGTNGAGKSTLLRAISGSQEASSGAVVFDGRDITHMPSHEIASRGIIHMPGGRGVFPGLSVRENLLLGNWLTDEEEKRTRLADVLEQFPILASRADEQAGTLSGGEQQMLSLAQAFLSRPKLLMIDELSLGLSPAVVGQLLEAVRKIHEQGTTIIVVEQSVNVALALAERAIFMEKGEVKFVGETADLLRRPDILRAIYVKGTGGATGVVRAAPHRLGQPARTVLEVDGVVKRFGGVTALDHTTFSVADGQRLGIIGPNGSGKTTLFDIISGYQTLDEGSIRFDGVDITNEAPEERARRGIVRRFQDARLFPALTVFEALLLALDQRLEVKGLAVSAAGLPHVRRAERRLRARADRLVEVFELGAYRDKFVRELSTGLRRVVDLACVLGTEPKLLLLDEPSSGIAQAEAESLGPLLRRVAYETGCTIVLIEHDMPLITAVSDELLAMERGAVLLRGAPDVVLNDERVAESYLGGNEVAVRRSGILAE